MKLVYSAYGIIFELEENKVNILVIENPTVLVEVVGRLNEQCEGKDGEFILSNENKILNISKSVSFVKDPFSIDCNNRKILTKLYQELERESMIDWNEEQQEFYKSYISYVTNEKCEKLIREHENAGDFMLGFVRTAPNSTRYNEYTDVHMECDSF